jgi:Ca2+-binding RTX toxin-like protein
MRCACASIGWWGDAVSEITGTEGFDSLTGTVDNDTLYGLGGGDYLNGNAGNDVIDGGGGQDYLIGGAGNDTVLGGEDHDYFGSEALFGDDSLVGGAGDDRFYDYLGSNVFSGGAGADWFYVYSASGSVNQASGGSEQDTYYVVPASEERVWVVTDFTVGAGGDLLNLDDLLNNSAYAGYNGGDPFAQGFIRLHQVGADTLLQWDYDGPANGATWYTQITLQNVTATNLSSDNFAGGIAGGSGAGTTLNGTEGFDSLVGTLFGDALYGLGGGDHLDGSAGNDLIEAGGGDDYLIGGLGNDTVLGGDGADYFSSERLFGDDSLLGGVGDDRFYDYLGNNVFSGGAGADWFYVYSTSGAVNQASGGSEQDTYDIIAAPGDRVWVVTDFEAGPGGDLLDVDSLLTNSALSGGYNGGDPFSQGFLQLFQSDADTLLQWDFDGAGEGSSWRTQITLQNVDADDITPDNFVGGIGGGSGAGTTLNGTEGFDSLVGTLFDDTLYGLGGGDHLDGSAGDDLIDAGGGDDYLIAGTGNDTVLGGEGADYFSSENLLGDDSLMGGEGDDRFYDYLGNNLFSGGAGADWFYVYSTSGAVNQASGGSEQDTYAVVPASEERVWVATDFQVGAGGDLLNLDGLLNSSAFAGYNGGDPFAQGFIRLHQVGADTLLQWDYDGPANGATWYTQITLQNVTAANLTSDNFVGLLIVGTADDDDLDGGLGNDTLLGLAGSDTLDGLLGGDSMEGGSGNDYYYVDDEGDVVFEVNNNPVGEEGPRLLHNEGGTVDTVDAAINYILGTYLENLLQSGGLDIQGTGNALDNFLRGNVGANVLDGLGGNDSIMGELGADTLGGGQGLDTIDGGAGDDWILGGRGNDLVFGQAGADHLEGSPGFDTLEGGTGNDSVYGGQAGDVLYGNRGGDLLDGGLGADSLYGAPGADLLIGGTGGDYLEGNFGIDTLIGGVANDTMNGGAGIDRFVYTSTSLGTDDVTAGGEDQIVATSGDLLDLQLLLGSINDEIVIVGNILQIDVNNDGSFSALQDFQISITGISSISFNSGDSLFHLT